MKVQQLRFTLTFTPQSVGVGVQGEWQNERRTSSGEWRTLSKESQLTFAYFSAHGESMQQTHHMENQLSAIFALLLCVCVCV